MFKIPTIRPIPSSIYRPSLRVIELEKENHKLRKKLREAFREKDERINQLEQIVQDLKIQLAELQAMLFKKKIFKQEKDKNSEKNKKNNKSSHSQRPKESYRRQEPKKEEITVREEYTLDECANCGGHLEDMDTRILYIEDLPETKKKVIQQLIHVYLCLDCSKEQSQIPIPRGHNVILGPRVKSFILHHTYILNVSYRDIIRSLWDYYHIKISEGEIQKIQEGSAKNLNPTYNSIRDELLKQESLNLDETGWKIKGAKNYLWGLFSPTTVATMFHIGSRGKGNAEDLLKDFNRCLTTDCYGCYKNLDGIFHQICWVHILREVKELCSSIWLSKEQHQSAEDFHKGLGIIYQKLKQGLDEPFDGNKRQQTQNRLIRRLRTINQILPCDTPRKLKNIKLRTQEYEQELFTCLQFKTALPENNLAERNLRHVVLKRKRSFGSQSEKGARIFAVNCSVILTLWKRFPNTFMKELERALGY